jgi:hypothetical protein
MTITRLRPQVYLHTKITIMYEGVCVVGEGRVLLIVVRVRVRARLGRARARRGRFKLILMSHA